MRSANHGVRIAVIWVVVSIIVEILISIAPVPAPSASEQAEGVRQTIYMLLYLGGPIFALIWVLLVYELLTFRRRRGEAEDEPLPRPDSGPVLTLWAGVSFLIVLFLAGWGTFTLKAITEANGPHPFPIQVIGQQWKWTFRYPTYGGMETGDLYVPTSTPIVFRITSLDVVHSFWLYNQDIKEDAVPGVQNIAYMEVHGTGHSLPNGTNWVKCNELCGLWHGYMKTHMNILTKSQFRSWANHQLAYEKSTGFLKYLPPYSATYFPAPNWPGAPQDQSP
ncbi:MAG: cytochrome c oxidase subunit II [Chloroflexota bacterium]